MLQITAVQYDAFAAQARQRFDSRLMDDIVQRYPEQVGRLRREDLKARLTEATNRALAYRVDAEEDVAAFVAFTIEFGAHFENDPPYEWVRSILNDRLRCGADKIEAIETGLARNG